MKSTPLAIELLKIDGDTQCRVKINEEVIADYADIISQSNGDWPFGPIDVFHDGTDYFVADGFHRTLAANRVKRGSIPSFIHKGSAYDAKIFGMTANDKHGLRMSRADKRACVEWLLDNGGKMTQKDIAAKAGVGTRLVKNIVAERNENSIAGKATPPKRDGKGQNAPYTPSSGVSDSSDEPDPFLDDGMEPGGEKEPASRPPRNGTEASAGKPERQFPRSHWCKQWDQTIGPLVKLVDKIGRNVNEMHGKHHKCVHEHLELATEEMMEWMGGK